MIDTDDCRIARHETRACFTSSVLFNGNQVIFVACLMRFRPILMTTMAALLSGLPLMLEAAGSELRKSLGYAMVGGCVSYVLTLYTTPVISSIWTAEEIGARLTAPRACHARSEAAPGERRRTNSSRK